MLNSDATMEEEKWWIMIDKDDKWLINDLSIIEKKKSKHLFSKAIVKSFANQLTNKPKSMMASECPCIVN